MTGKILKQMTGGAIPRFGLTVFAVLALLMASGCDSFGSASEAEYLERAEQRMESADYAAAIIEYRNALRLESRTSTRAALGQAYLADGQYDAAASHLERAFSASESQDLLLPLSHALFQLDRFADLAELPHPEGLEAKKAAEVFGHQAIAHIRLGQMEEAREALQAARDRDPELALLHLGEAYLALDDADIDAASDAAGRALERDGDLAPAWALVGDLAHRGGDPDAALDAYDRALERRPYQIAERLKRGLTHLEQGRYEEAAADAQFLRQGAPDHPGGHFLRGLVHFQQEELSEAQPYFEEALSRSRNYRPAMPYLAAILLHNGNLAQAEHHLERHSASGPDTAMTYRLWGRLEMQRGDPEAARSRLEQALERHPEMTPALGDMLAGLYLESENPDRGVEFLRTAHNEGQGSPTMRRMLARALLERGEEDEAHELMAAEPEQDQVAWAMSHIANSRYAEALEVARAMIADDRQNVQGYNIKGAALLGLNRIEEGRLAFQEGAQANPESVSIAMNLGALEVRLGNLDAAREVFEDLQEMSPGHAASAMQLASMATADGDHEAALRWLEGAMQHHPEEVEPALMLTRLPLTEDRAPVVLALLEEALENHPEQPELLSTIAHVHEALGQHAEALPPLERLADVSPDDADVQFALARVRAATGDEPGSTAALRRVLELDSSHVTARHALTHHLAAAGEVDAAREVFAPLLDTHGEEPGVIARDAWLLAREDEHAAAVARYTEALEQESSRQWVVERHQSRLQAGLGDEALRDLEQWLDDNPQDLGVRHLLGSAQLGLDREDAARETYRAILAQQSEDVVALNNLAWLLRKEETEEALGYAERARDLAPEEPAILDTLGVVLLYSDDPEAARDVLESAYSDAATTPGIGYNLARALVATGDEEAARDVLDAVLSAGDSFAEREDASALRAELD
ncbi:XrtA/PEP-CTERM system TPR-repeat protein PrsT [Thioalkalivibrio sp. ALJT]|uniref:XrtA/PEP-CTERM system TPR-repeat protein PrsT n=1 Tax=Thioalkalivibrio sp. ALJT TaxID=1158146 RepID=UPI0003821887|nr:XrtA/PEP-CTERM system TPR-repeat protein PrsT [Thioalkalivibrio sp. ALJT]